MQRTDKDYSDLIVAVLVFSILGYGAHLLKQEDAKLRAEAAMVQKNTITETVTTQTFIYSLTLQNEITGHIQGASSGEFFLGIGGFTGNVNGNIGETSYYYFYKDNGDKGIILSKANAETTALVTRPLDSPYLETVTEVTKQFRAVISSRVVSQTLYVPIEYKLIGEFKK